MVFESTDPLRSRPQFIARPYVNMAVIAGLFILCVSALSIWVSNLLPGRLLPMLTVDAIALGGAYGLYMLWDKRPIWMRCGHCRKLISSNTPWFCTICNRPNRNSADYPFVHKCEHCGAEPKAYRCHHPECGKLIFLSADEDATNYAHRLNSPVEVQARESDVLAKAQRKEDKEHDIEMARLEIVETQLNDRLKAIKDSADKVRKPVLEARKESLKEFLDSHLAVEEAARQQKAANAEDCQDDKASLRRRNLAVDDWVRRQMAGDE